MQRTLLIVAAAAIAVTATPALAKSKKHHRAPQGYLQGYVQPEGPYGYGPYGYGRPWVSRNVSDPSFGNRSGINYARRTGRCVEDLGYGRYEYCNW